MRVQNDSELEALREIGRIVRGCINWMAEHLEPGLTTAELDQVGGAYLHKHGARSAPILAYDYPGFTCISVNTVAAHGIPSDDVVIRAGDLVNIDVSAEKNGYWADAGSSFPVSPVTHEAQALLTATRTALDLAIGAARAGGFINEVGKAVQGYAEANGYSVIRELGGHGVGRHIHESPQIPNVYVPHFKERFKDGQVVTLEPFLALGAQHVKELSDGWTLLTRPETLVAQFEHTLVITKNEPIIITTL